MFFALTVTACLGGPMDREPLSAGEPEEDAPTRRRPPIREGGRMPPDRRVPMGGGDEDDGGWTLVEVRDAKAREAVCNDGQPATWFVRPGAEGQTRWVVFLEGGGLCSSVQECDRRPPMRKSPATAMRPPPSQGIFSTDASKNPDFHDWNAVFLPYCSSDFWIGDAPASSSNGSYAFRGARIVDAVIEDLKQGVEAMPPLSGATDLLLGGGSAGSMGVRHHIDAVASSLKGVRVLGLADSGFEPFAAAGLPSPADARVSEQLAMWKPRVDASCEKAAGTEKCLDFLFVMDHVEAPMFVYMDQFDANALGRARIADRGSPEAGRFAGAVREGLKRFPASFSTQAGIHVLSIKDNFSDLKVPAQGGRYSLAEVLGGWVFDRPVPRHVAAE